MYLGYIFASAPRALVKVQPYPRIRQYPMLAQDAPHRRRLCTIAPEGSAQTVLGIYLVFVQPIGVGPAAALEREFAKELTHVSQMR